MISSEALLKTFLPELIQIEQIADKISYRGDVRIEQIVEFKGLRLPIYSFAFGREDPNLPAICFVGGVHGLERIGTRLLLSYLETFRELLKWDEVTEHMLERCRILFYPMVNPGGVYMQWRANPNGVDLMRNAPIEAESKPVFLVGGHTYSKRLPWYRGKPYEEMELESQALCDFVRRRVLNSKFALTLDVHSGFGQIDRLWFPYARSQKPFHNLVEMYALKRKLDQTLPNHVYRVEPQSLQYVTHGDLWDYLYEENLAKQPGHVFLPLTIEMGSWMWVKKNPRQLFSALGAFNPLLPHRTRRIMRRHLALLDFLMRATTSYDKWLFPVGEKKRVYHEAAVSDWFTPKIAS